MMNRRNIKNELETIMALRQQIKQVKPGKVKEKIINLEKKQIGRKYKYRQTSKSILDVIN